RSMRFKADCTIWAAKQQILCTLTQSLRDVLNYGLFQPAVDGKESTFLDEEKLIRDHTFPSNNDVPTLEFRYKSRVYQHANINEKQIEKLHTQANLKKFLEFVQHHQVDKVTKLLERGLDPNYHDSDTGETPLTLAAHLDNMVEMIIALKNGGAHLDFRSRDGMTALHKAVRAKNQITLKALLELGASPDYKDGQGLTPLYHTVTVGGDPSCCEVLLHAQATLTCHDENGWHEIHQACRYGHVQHLEHLLFYGADMRVQNASGNTALHICALYKQENCARVLLLRGASKEVKNYRGQTPFQVAIIAGNFELAEFIKSHKDDSIVPFREAPTAVVVSSGRSRPQQPQAGRSTLAAPRVLLRSNSDNNLNVNKLSAPHTPSRSPSPLRSLSPRRPQQMQNSSNGTVKSMGRGARHPPRSRSPSLGRLGDGDARRHPPQRHSSSLHFPPPHSPRPGRDAFSGAETPGSKRRMYSAVPGRHYVVVKSYQPQAEGEIALYKNDRVKVLSVGEGGFWEGSARGNVGWFPSECVEEIPNKANEDRPYARADRSERRKLFRHYTVGSYDSFDASSDCVIDEKTVVLQKKDNEGFGFVLRGAKADTPIEEFSPTPAFPALQYLESVDEGGVAWQAGLRTGDFLIEVNKDNVVKVGHKQVVNMIRHGGNHLIIKVVTVSRNLDPDDTARKKAPVLPRRAPSTALSTRSKSMTSELEDLVSHRQMLRREYDNFSKKNIIQNQIINKTEIIQEMSVDSAPVTATPKGPFLGIPKGAIRRQTSIGKFSIKCLNVLTIALCSQFLHRFLDLMSDCCTQSVFIRNGVTEEEKQFLTPPMLKFTRSLSMPDTSEDIPPPPAISPPSPPHNNAPTPAGHGYGTIRPGFTPQSPTVNNAPSDRGDSSPGPGWRDQGMYYQKNSEQYDAKDYSNSPTAQQSLHMRRAQIPENPYSDVGKLANAALFVPNKPARRKGMLVKQSNVEDSPEKTCSIPIPTIIIKEPSTSSSGKSSQGSSMEIETSTPDHPGQLRPDDGVNTGSPFAPAIASSSGREKRLEIHRNSPSFRSTDAGDEDVAPAPTPRLRHSKSIDEGMFSSDERLRRLMAPPSSLLSIPRGGGNVTDFNSPEPTMVRELLNTRTGSGNYVHPVTGKPLDPNSPLALALAARDRAMREQSQPLPLKSDPSKLDLNKPLFIDTKLRPNVEVSFSSTATMGRPRGGLRRQMTESKFETESKFQLDLGKIEKRPEEKKNMLIDIVDTSQQKSAGLLMVHTTDGTKTEENSLSEGERDEDVCPDSTPGELRDPNQPVSSKPAPLKPLSVVPPKTMISVSSVDEPVKLPFGIPPPPLASVDIDEEFVFAEPLPPPLEFANSFDIPEDQGALSELLKQKSNGMSVSGPTLAPYYPHLTTSNSRDQEIKRPTVLTNCTPPSFPTGPLEPYEPIIDSGIEVDSRSSGDPQLETTSTVSTVSSISTLSSEGGETLDTCMVYADGQAFLVDRAQVLPKPKAKYAVNKSNALYKDALNEETISSFRVPSSIPPPPLGTAPPEPLKTPTQRTSKLWGEPLDLKPPHGPETKPQSLTEINSVLQHVSKDKAPKPEEALDSPPGCRTHFGLRRNQKRGRDTLMPPPTADLLSLTLICYRDQWLFTDKKTDPKYPVLYSTHIKLAVFLFLRGCKVCIDYQLNNGSLKLYGSPNIFKLSFMCLYPGTQPNPGVSFTNQPGPNVPAPSPCRQAESLHHHRHPSSPSITSPPPILSCSSSSSSLPAVSTTSSVQGRSRSPSPLSFLQAASGKPFASKAVLSWTKQDVADWLESLNLAEHRDAFLENDIEGTHLPSLQKQDLIDLGVTRVGHRMNIERALKLLLDR
ncbi:SH3 and multiple ankyrin repeat domains protein 2 isoform X2, partial [Silurus asotus]